MECCYVPTSVAASIYGPSPTAPPAGCTEDPKFLGIMIACVIAWQRIYEGVECILGARNTPITHAHANFVMLRVPRLSRAFQIEAGKHMAQVLTIQVEHHGHPVAMLDKLGRDTSPPIRDAKILSRARWVFALCIDMSHSS